jgi:hypothetical protein
MSTIDNIPKDLVKDDEKTQFIEKEISEMYCEFNKQVKTTTELELKIGQMLNTLKQVVKNNGMTWKEYKENNLSYINIITIQCWMKLAKVVDIESYPNLAYAGRNRLLTLARVAKKNNSEIHSFLKKKRISPNFRTTKKDAVRIFRDKVDALIEKQYRKKKGKIRRIR